MAVYCAHGAEPRCKGHVGCRGPFAAAMATGTPIDGQSPVQIILKALSEQRGLVLSFALDGGVKNT